MTPFLKDILISDPNAPIEVWNHFEQFCVHPRPSKHEEKIRQYLISFAESKNLKWKKDKVGNVIIYVPGTNNLENSSSVLVQNHIDMVTDALPEKEINFFNDSIEPYVDGDWVKAKGTTLGADNGIGASMALSLIDFHNKFSHPPLELLFTVDEETGLTGALELDETLIKSSKMINLDTEEWGAIYIGCTGGMDVKFSAQIPTNQENGTFYELKIQGLCGGHSGLDIHRQRGNALVIGLDFLILYNNSIRLIQIDAGKAHNVIPRSASIKFSVVNLSESELQKKFVSWKNFIASTLSKEDLASLVISLEKKYGNYQAIHQEFWNKKLKYFFQFLPNGAHRFELESKQEVPLVSLSNNFAVCKLHEGSFNAATSIRFFKQEEGNRLKNKCISLAEQTGLQYEVRDGYPSWTPDFESQFLKKIVNLYREKFSIDPKIKAIHAGLECGIILAKKPGMQAISIGPCISGAHSPDEKVLIKDVSKAWSFLIFVLGKFIE